MGRHASSTTRPASVRGVPLVGRPGPTDGARRHAGPPERARGRGAGVLTGFALLAGAVLGTAAVQTAAMSEPPVLAEPASPPDTTRGDAARPVGSGPTSAPRPVLGSAPSPRTRGMSVSLAGGVEPVPAPPRP